MAQPQHTCTSISLGMQAARRRYVSALPASLAAKNLNKVVTSTAVPDYRYVDLVQDAMTAIRLRVTVVAQVAAAFLSGYYQYQQRQRIRTQDLRQSGMKVTYVTS